ncbi:MAG: alkaline phosphatase family protein [Planctomycetota bacterium]|jgi:predicted AlkP superfamily phosphohydrolase/phosphomutase
MTAKRLMIIGFDGAMPEHLAKFVAKGIMPNVSALMARGAAARALPCTPADTPTNWTTIVTGAWPGTHGITSFTGHTPGEPLDVGFATSGAEATAHCRAEYLWDVAERAGKRVVVLNYMCSWPPTMERGVTIGGFDMNANFAAESAVFFVKGERRHEDVECAGFDDGPFTLVESAGAGHDRVAVGGCELQLDQWSDWLFDTVTRDGRDVDVAFRYRLNALSADGTTVEVFRTPLYMLEDWAHPPEVAREIVEAVGPCASGTDAGAGWEHPDLRFDDDQLLQIHFESVRHQLNYLVDVAKYLNDADGWDVLITQVHLQDELCHHDSFGFIDPACPAYTPAKAERQWAIVREHYRLMDEQVGRYVAECGGDDTLTVVISDHAAVPFNKVISTNQVLQAAGLLTVDAGPDGQAVIDWSQTKAYCPFFLPEEYIWVNLKGRDPQGSVESEDYDAVVDEVIAALQTVRDPETGECPVALALRKADAAHLGHFGDRASDVIYFWRPGYGMSSAPLIPNDQVGDLVVAAPGWGDHSGYLPTAEAGGCSNSAIFVMAGPGVKEGIHCDEPICLIDVAPTIVHLLGIPAPAHADGHVLDQMLEP